jgi:hypothetical protein
LLAGKVAANGYGSMSAAMMRFEIEPYVAAVVARSVRTPLFGHTASGDAGTKI